MTTLTVRPVTPERWPDVTTLAGERGFTGGCWCMWWRLSNNEMSSGSAADKRDALRELVDAGREPGLLAYATSPTHAGPSPGSPTHPEPSPGGEPIGWVAIAPRDEHQRLERSTKLYPVDDVPVWSVTCFYVHRNHRRSGVMEELLAAAVDHASAQGAEQLEGYPIDTSVRKRTSAEIFTGTLTLFERAGFIEVARRGGRPIVRKQLGQ